MKDSVQRRVDFWSSVECALFLQGLIGALDVHDWSGAARFEISESQYRGARSRMARLALRWKTYVHYPWMLRQALRKRSLPDVAVVCTNTFYAPRMAEWAGRRTPVVHWVFDLFPDVLLLSGELRNGSVLTKALNRLTRATFDNAAVNVFLGERLLAHAIKRFGPIPRSVVIPVGCDARPFADSPPELRSRWQPVRVLYCGNLGRMHDVDTMLGAFQGGLPDNIELKFCGNGAGFALLGQAVRERNLANRVAMSGSLNEADWVAAMRAADVALVTMKPGAEGVVMPSKTYSALAAGQAVLAICPEKSDLAETIRKHDCGWVVFPGDVKRLNVVLDEIAGSPNELLRRRENAWKAGQQAYDQRALAGAWSEVLEAAIGYKQKLQANKKAPSGSFIESRLATNKKKSVPVV